MTTSKRFAGRKRKRMGEEDDDDPTDPDPNWRRAQYKGQWVYVQVDARGDMVVDRSGCATMRYRNHTSAQLYHPSRNNLVMPSEAQPRPPSQPLAPLLDWKSELTKWPRHVHVGMLTAARGSGTTAALAAYARFVCGPRLGDCKTLDRDALVDDASRLVGAGVSMVRSMLETYGRMGELMDVRPTKKPRSAAEEGKLAKVSTDMVWLVLGADNAELFRAVARALEAPLAGFKHRVLHCAADSKTCVHRSASKRLAQNNPRK